MVLFVVCVFFNLLSVSKWQPTPVLLPGEAHGRKSLVGYSPWGLEESDTTEQLHFTSLKYFQCGVKIAKIRH